MLILSLVARLEIGDLCFESVSWLVTRSWKNVQQAFFIRTYLLRYSESFTVVNISTLEDFFFKVYFFNFFFKFFFSKCFIFSGDHGLLVFVAFWGYEVTHVIMVELNWTRSTNWTCFARANLWTRSIYSRVARKTI